MALVSFLYFFILSQLVFLLSAEGCPPSFNCGNLGHIRFPFTSASRPECGLCVIYGCEHPDAFTQIQLVEQGRKFPTGSITQDNSVMIQDDILKLKLDSSNCETLRHNLSLPPSSPLVSFHIKYNITLFSCNRTLKINAPGYFKNTSCHDYDIYYRLAGDNSTKFPSSLTGCSSCQLPLKVIPYSSIDASSDPFSVLAADFLIEVKLSDKCGTCYYSKGGQCRVDSKGKFYCAEVSCFFSKVTQRHIAPMASQLHNCNEWLIRNPRLASEDSTSLKDNRALKLGLGASIAGVGMLIIICFCSKRKLSSLKLTHFWKKKSHTHDNIEAFLRDHGPISIRRYSYSDIRNMTSSFKDKLGQGGYGSVYKGKLPDGCPVAVKVLSESKGNGEDFLNEVASISRTSHVNIVTLLAFCFKGSKRALVYEFMPNGSLEKFVYEENQLKGHPQLDFETLFQIAIGVAKGLEYLHKGCNTRILHFDIKPSQHTSR
ncbi:Receptor-like protein kinase [Quillaja saponaria]|uniref:Receptor-like protein kinase n=1 Tax=Quillaja saponaria TaxID=32244 RepID=A0AAD7P5V5_QUISA|nr:Receptor-like protein kinase [Quillaja saponaria]